MAYVFYRKKDSLISGVWGGVKKGGVPLYIPTPILTRSLPGISFPYKKRVVCLCLALVL